MDKRILPKAKDRISCLYIEKSRIEQSEFAIQIIQNGQQKTEIPIATISAIFLGPGTTITHAAIKNICNVGCTIIWCGDEFWKFYASGDCGTKSSKNILLQMQHHESKMKHMQVVRNMYKMRYPDAHINSKSLEELRGMEGQRVQNLYYDMSAQYGVSWNGRKYDITDFESQDIINQSLTYTNQILYGVIKSVLHLMGFSPAIGFIHTGHMDSFVFDIADLYKEHLTIPISFQFCSNNCIFNKKILNAMMRKEIVEFNLMRRITKDIYTLFEQSDYEVDIDIQLWNGKDNVSAGKNYG